MRRNAIGNRKNTVPTMSIHACAFFDSRPAMTSIRTVSLRTGGAHTGRDAKIPSFPTPQPALTPMPHRSTTLAQADPELWAAITDENARQEAHIELIASENYASRAVLAAQGSQLTNKYAEGYPGKRYYGGCEYVDVAERLAIVPAHKLVPTNFAHVHPHSRAPATPSRFFQTRPP